jgi:hypothetical protein
MHRDISVCLGWGRGGGVRGEGGGGAGRRGEVGWVGGQSGVSGGRKKREDVLVC